MAPALPDVDLDALAPRPKTVKVGGQLYKLPGDMPMPLFVFLQSAESKIASGQGEEDLITELYEELLALFQVHQPELKRLPASIGVQGLMGVITEVYSPSKSSGKPASPNRATRRQRTRTASPKAPSRARAAAARRAS